MSFLTGLFLSLSFFLFSAPKAYDVRMNLALEGSEKTLPPFTIEEGATKTIETDIEGKKSSIEILAVEEIRGKTPTVKIKFKISTLNEMGEKVLLSTPTLVTQYGQLAEVSVGKQDGKEQVGLSLLVERR